ncbi:MAG: hypothetical protein A3K19_11920 [Lentisphaerae bacterium RIFOXYB12_FULL_65_16]|nr:MAG: hypothetical protein A3K18_27100 [Lentisphaerae bacterium RIFOXYA12_64_32]OGV87966.1 MAG: hypothetical protein A3K19_11920 [Lentisphaerae bacterium RIFOXYB12_FULL_65_16]
MPEPVHTVISNTSPLFYLHRIGCLDVLKRLYGSVTVTPAVVQELAAGASQGEDVPDVTALPWVVVRQVSVPPFLSLIPDLGAGEASVLALATEMEEACLVIIDDRLGRRIAGLHALRCTGTAGVLLKSKRAGIIPRVLPCLAALDRAGFYLTSAVKRDILDLAGEL